jgi:hypothetical protein
MALSLGRPRRLPFRFVKRAALAGIVAMLASFWVMTPAGASVVQPQTGAALGTASYDVGTVGTDIGAYRLSGQLGSGRYDIAVSCDSPTLDVTATLTRSDGLVLSGHTVGGADGCFPPGDMTVDVSSATGDIATAHLLFHRTVVPPRVTTCCIEGDTAFSLSGTSTARERVGYTIVSSSGQRFAFGGLPALSNATISGAVHIELAPSGTGEWVVDGSGSVFAFGTAPWLGNLDRSVLRPGERAVSLSTTPTGRGYWIFTNQGRVQRFGDASFLGDVHALSLNAPIVGSRATPTGDGYYMVAADGGVFAFGNAPYRGSMGGHPLHRPVVAITPNAAGSGYWLAASDGGVFSFNAPFHGSLATLPLTQPIVGIARYGDAYLMTAADGGVFNLSGRPFYGSAAGVSNTPVVGVAAVG